MSRGTVAECVTKIRRGNSSPAVYPLLLNGIQRLGDSALAVRLPSAIFSLLAVLVLLGLPRMGLDPNGALLAGAILAVSPSQVRYAQEVREYSLAVLVAAAMIFALAGLLRNGERRAGGTMLAILLLLAPLVQYGLVLFAGAVILVAAAGRPGEGFRNRSLDVLAMLGFLAAGSVLTFVLTLRGQWRVTGAWYLQEWFYGGALTDLAGVLAFVGTRLGRTLAYLTLGEWSAILAIPAAGAVALLGRGTWRSVRGIWLLAPLSLAGVSAAAVLRLYPLGPVRQDLFLAPVIAVAVGLGWAASAGRFRHRWRIPATAAILVLILAAGLVGVLRSNPYREVEDIRTVLTALRSRPAASTVYVYYGARPALRFYGAGGPDFVYGGAHRGDPGAYAREFRELVGPDSREVWIVYSHVHRGEIRRLVDDLRTGWTVEPVVRARGAGLYRATRRPGRTGSTAPGPRWRDRGTPAGTAQPVTRRSRASQASMAASHPSRGARSSARRRRSLRRSSSSAAAMVRASARGSFTGA